MAEEEKPQEQPEDVAVTAEDTEAVDSTETTEVTEPVELPPELTEEEKAALRETRRKQALEMFDQHHSFIFKKVKSITFGMLSPKMIKKMACAKVVTPELYDKEGYPVDGGLMDTRLGVIDPGLKCKTCGSKLKECIGHFGYIELARPSIHISFVKVVHIVLNGSCRECGKGLLTKQKADKMRTELDRIELEQGLGARRQAVKELQTILKTVTKCPHCKAKQYKIKIEKPTTFLEAEKRISPIEIRTRLEKVPDEDCWLFGINPGHARPEWMVLTILGIPPVTMRPSITLETGERSEDDLTHKLGDIVRINQRLFENINAGAPEIIIEDLWDLLQYHVTTFFDNSVAQLPPARHRSGQPLKTITERIKSKEGRIRHNLAGKRTNYCARTVISPDPMIQLNEVGVPKVVAMKLSIPEMVTNWNMAYLKSFVENGPDKYPGANYVVRPDGKKKKITDETKEASLEEIQPGYIVERHLLDGDIAIFNRQPSLHRMSMMAHKIRVLPFKTLRLNPTVCRPYNADFDGDEMNLHIPQTEEARAEAETLMEVQHQLISPAYGLSVIGCVQDALSGDYLLTKELEYDRHTAVDILATIGIEDFSRLPDKKVLNGKEIFSTLLPVGFNFKGKDKSGNPVVIKKGILVEGIMDGANLGGGSGLMLRLIHKEYGPEYTIQFLQNVTRLGIEVLFRNGFTSGISHFDMPPEAEKMIEDTLCAAEDTIKELISKFESGNFEPYVGKTIEETLESKILLTLNKARNKCGTIVAEFAMPSNSLSIILSGAKGKVLNLAQMAAVVGQQAMRGQRIDKGYTNRTLSCFKEGSLDPDARGFVRSSYKKGMNPKEFFFQSMTGRDSLMDTALRTPKSGYLYRRLANALQDLKVVYDKSVRDSGNKIIQFEYGEDSIDVAKSEGGVINVQSIVDQVSQ